MDWADANRAVVVDARTATRRRDSVRGIALKLNEVLLVSRGIRWSGNGAEISGKVFEARLAESGVAQGQLNVRFQIS